MYIRQIYCMSNNNILSQKTEDILSNSSILDFPDDFEHMYNIELCINKLDSIEICVDYNCEYGETHIKKFAIRTVEDENIILRPKQMIGNNHILLLENNGPFILQR